MLFSELLESFTESRCLCLYLEVFSLFSSTNFKISGTIFGSLVHFTLIFVQSKRQGSSFNLLHRITSFPSTICCRVCLSLSPTYVFTPFVKNQMAVAMWVYLCIPYCISFTCTFIFMPEPCCPLSLWLCSIF